MQINKYWGNLSYTNSRQPKKSPVPPTTKRWKNTKNGQIQILFKHKKQFYAYSFGFNNKNTKKAREHKWRTRNHPILSFNTWLFLKSIYPLHVFTMNPTFTFISGIRQISYVFVLTFLFRSEVFFCVWGGYIYTRTTIYSVGISV